MHHVLTPRVHIRPLIQKGGYPEKGRFDEKTDEKYGVVPPEKEKRWKPPSSLDEKHSTLFQRRMARNAARRQDATELEPVAAQEARTRYDEKTDEKYGVVPPEKEKRWKPPTSLDDDSDRLHYPPDWSPTDVVDMIADTREVVASREEIARSEAFIRRAEARLRRMARNVARRQRRGNADAL